MKHINIIITTLFLTTIAFAVTVDGNAFLDGQTDHSGVTITFVRTAPSSLTETATTDASGYYTAELETGVYDVAYTKDNYFSTSLMGRSLWSSTTLSNITLTKRITQLNVPSKIDYKIDHIVAKENERLSNIQLTSNSSSIFWVEPRIREDYQPVEVLFTERSVREWCGTMPWWESRNSGQRSCDLYGATDDPTVRDSYIPNTNTDVKYFRLYIHAFADNNGDNPTSTLANAEAQLLTLNEAFLDYKIQFTALFQIHNDSQYQSIGSADWSAGVFKALYAEDPTTYHNLYVMDTDANWSILGVSTFPWDSEAITSYGGTIIDKDWFGGPRTFNGAVNIPQHTITHELGHALGLWHTHHGVDEVTSCGSCYEGADGYTYATGNDANVVGDLCSDTKATPTNFTCADPTGVDCQSNFWVNTDVHNFMGYADDDCYDLSNDGFSSQQSGRVHGWITDKYEGLVSSSNQRILLSASFEDGIPSDWTIADNDADGNAWFAGTETTSFDLAYFGVKGMVISYNASGNDDWLITPEITIPQNSVSPTFKFWARSHHPSLLEDFIVRISTNGSNFSSLGATYSASSVWTQYSYDLSSYAGESIYLALQCVSVDEYYLFADDFLVSTNLSPLEANFSANPVSGNAALITNFTDISGGSPTSWSWDFGDGNTSSTQHPTHNYESPGAYTVSLTISDGIDSDTETKSDYINVTAPLEGIFTESFENYSDFEINSIGDWTIIDNDGGSTWGLSDVIYPNVGYVGSGIIFNPSQTTPSTLGTNLDTYSGSKGLYFFASGSGGTTTPNDDWMITPQIDLTGVSNTIFSFWAKSFIANYGLERIQVAISNTGTNEADFSVISSENYIEIPTSYTQFIYDLSAWDNQEIYIGIHYVTDNAFLLQMDEFIVNGNINDNPVLASIGNQSTNEDMAKVVTLSATDVESDGLTFTAASAETNVTATVDGTSLTLTPADVWNGTADITVTVTDDGTGTLTDSETFTLTVNPINDNPVLTYIGVQSTNEDTAKVVTLSATDIENDGLTYSAASAESNVTA
ncbi:MAG: PKD domain-containing protein, partial [Candidatus Marinimicrobia bacterium]|nr:PKD domain-containing protein [Candidatus Neomarinimicrobiota bacterium]